MKIKDVTPGFNVGEDDQKRSNRPQGKGPFKARSLYLILILLAAVYYYILLPPLHYASGEFWFFLGLILVGVILIELINDSSRLVKNLMSGRARAIDWKHLRVGKKYRLLLSPVIALGLVFILTQIIFSPLFMSQQFSSLLQPTKKDIQTDFPEVDVNQIPLVDRDTAERLGDRRLGSLTDLVSQFEVSPEYTQINIKAEPYRVTPLKYAGLFKWLNNFREGIPHYLQVNNVTGQVEVMTPDKPIRYSYADHFNRYIMRHLRFNYPFTLFGRPAFEIDDEGTPYYIATTFGRNFFLKEPEPTGLILVNAMTGDHQHYDLKDIPTWVDRVYPADLVLHQLSLNGNYRFGFWNSLFAKEGVTRPSEGYNYLPMKDDLYLYTGITSVSSDDSNIGFVLVNLRTKEATMYPQSAAEEFSAMESAEGSVQEKGYVATFPLLINLQGKPMYILTLKDSSGLIKSYALVDVENYQNVYVAPSVSQLMANYASDHPLEVMPIDQSTLKEVTGEVESIQAVVRQGETIYYFMVDGQVYQAPASLNDFLPFLEEGQVIQFKQDDQGNIHVVDLTETFGDQAQTNQDQAILEEVEDPLVDQLAE